MTKRQSFIIHNDSLAILDDMTNEQAGIWIKSIKFYQKNGTLPELDFGLKMAIIPFINQFIRDEESYKKTCEARRLAGAEGGKQKVANASKSKQKVANLADNENKSDNKNRIELKIKSKDFIKPTLQEIQDYCKERNNGVNPTKFFDYYSTSNWKDKDGKQVKNWKQKVITWESRNGKEEKNNQTLCQAINQIIGNDWIIKIEAIEEKAVLSITQANWQKIKGLSDEIKKKIKDKLNQELKTTEIKQKYIG